jgi:hypothetical protein
MSGLPSVATVGADILVRQQLRTNNGLMQRNKKDRCSINSTVLDSAIVKFPFIARQRHWSVRPEFQLLCPTSHSRSLKLWQWHARCDGANLSSRQND